MGERADRARQAKEAAARADRPADRPILAVNPQTLRAQLEAERTQAQAQTLTLERPQATGSCLLFGIGTPDPDKYELDLIWPGATGAEPPTVTNFEGPRSAYDAARSERFDGKPLPASAAKGPIRWY